MSSKEADSAKLNKTHEDLEQRISEIIKPIKVTNLSITWILYNTQIEFFIKNVQTKQTLRTITLGEKENIYYHNNDTPLTMEIQIMIDQEAHELTREIYKHKKELLMLCGERKNLIEQALKLTKEH